MCGRGASSLMSRRPSAVRKNSTVRTPTVPSAWATARASVAGLLRDDRADRRGHDGRVEDVPLVPVQADRDRSTAWPSAPRATTTETSAANVDPALGHARRPGPRLAQAASASSARVDPDLPLAVVARGGRLEDQGQARAPRRPRPARPRSAPAARGRAGSRAGRGSVFSRSRFWLTQTVRQPGRTGRRRASQRRAGAETFSNSTVTASACSANVRRAGRWSGGATTDQWATCAAGASAVGLRTPVAIAHPLRGLDEHPAELAAADHAERRGRVERRPRWRSRPAHSGDSPTASVCAWRKAARASRIAGYLPGQDRRGQQRRVGRAGGADGQRPDRDPSRHLDDRQQRIDPAEHLALDRHARAPAGS